MDFPNAKQYEVTPNRPERRARTQYNNCVMHNTPQNIPQEQNDMTMFLSGAVIGTAVAFLGMLCMLDN